MHFIYSLRVMMNHIDLLIRSEWLFQIYHIDFLTKQLMKFIKTKQQSTLSKRLYTNEQHIFIDMTEQGTTLNKCKLSAKVNFLFKPFFQMFDCI